MELIRHSEDLIQNTLIEYQGLVRHTLHPSPPISYMIASNTTADPSILEIGNEEVSLYLICRDNLETHSFSWSREINTHSTCPIPLPSTGKRT